MTELWTELSRMMLTLTVSDITQSLLQCAKFGYYMPMVSPHIEIHVQ